MVRHRRMYHKRLTFNIPEQEHILNTHIDQLAEWWENAEKGEAAPGDWIITHGPDDTNPAYIIEQAPRYPLSSKRQPYRILARAPKPKPAWHDAPAVTATYRDDCGMVSGVWTPSGNHGYWIGPEDDVVTHDSLEDVTPLIEAKVTDEMRARAIAAYEDDHGSFAARITATLTAALGIEAE